VYPPPADPEAAARLLSDFPGATRELRPLLECLGGNSPYLSELALREPDNLLAIAANGPDAVCDAALGALARIAPTEGTAAIGAALRQAKRAVALAASVADIGGAWSLAQVTGALSDLAEGALRLSVAHLLRRAHGAGQLRLPHPGAPDRGSGFTVLAMGKLGARELNYSSDVDLILLYDPAAHPGREDGLGQVFARLARDLVKLMEGREAGGYVFRVDLRLRPDPASTPPAIALPGALAYYEGMGQTWERAALIKARPVAGDVTLGRRFLREISPFVWRRHLDFAAIADIHAMKRRMDDHKGTSLGNGKPVERLLGHNLKLGEGGIREIEFCAQTLQLVWAGRAPGLRMPATLPALDALAGAGHLPADEVAALAAAYRFLRRAEHRLQMVADRQTHSLPDTLRGLEDFARFLGFADGEAFAVEALRHMTAVHGIFGGLFADLAVAPDEAGTPVPDAVKVPAFAVGWLEGRPRALRTERSRTLLRELLPAIEAAIARQPDPAAAAVRLDDFLHRLPTGVQLLSMLLHNPALLDRLADVLGAAPWLADHMAEAPAALEGLAGPLGEVADPAVALGASLKDARGLDDALSIASRLVRAEEFSAAVDEFFARTDVDSAARRRAALADAVVAACLRLALADHETRYGRVPEGGVAVVALGKAGSREMMAGSDLDLMLIYDHPEEAESSGPKVLGGSQYYARAAQGVIAALTVPTRHGPLYQVDMRLRPSGAKGPVAVSLASFERYHRESAWTWERLALTRARVVAVHAHQRPAHFRRRVMSAIAGAIRGADRGRVLADTVDMRVRLAREKPPKGNWDARLRDGGLMELEFIGQALQLVHAGRKNLLAPGTVAALENLARTGVLPAADAEALVAAGRFWRTLMGVMRVALGREVPRELPGPLVEKLLRATGVGPDEAALRARADAVAAEVRAAFVRHVGALGTA
jgi:[glutamine synthetase] adenylyltransferase / [glutamine synthetase]-adenylyl-L-tyrosine phosphorylase